MEESPHDEAAATRRAIRRAFPRSLGSTVSRAVELIPETASWGPRGHALELDVGGERVVIPGRIYVSEPRSDLIASLDQEAAIVLGCAYTRHHDGFIRERSVQTVLGFDRSWIVPFVVLLLGEYVVEIAEVALRRLDELHPDTYRRFAEANPAFMSLTRNRIISYWWCYYTRYRLPDYPPVRVLTELGLWDGPEGRRRLKLGRPSS